VGVADIPMGVADYCTVDTILHLQHYYHIPLSTIVLITLLTGSGDQLNFAWLLETLVGVAVVDAT